MRFITEDELRTCYKKEPFTSYQLEDGTKLTPGARQFLQDRGILMFQGSKSSVQNGNVPKRKIITDETGCDISNNKFLLKVKSIEIKFLKAASDLLKSDVDMAESVINLRRKLSEIRDKEFKEDIISGENRVIEKSDCEKTEDLDITEFHIQLEKGKEILILSELKLVLEELLIDIPVCFTAEEGERSYKISNRVKDIIKDINSMIHAAYGGNVCQRK